MTQILRRNTFTFMKKSPYYIIEVANTHGGNRPYLDELIAQFSNLKDNFGIKFQAFSPDTIATKDFEWYPVYQELYFSPNDWKEIISEAKKSKDVWLDLFDAYGVQILNENIDKIKGIKFQSSVLQNQEVFDLLASTNLQEKIIILNIAAQSIEAIEAIIEKVNNNLRPQKIMLEIGFQSYPTLLEDSGLNKIAILKNHFKNEIVFADHTEGKSNDALTLPLIAVLNGVDAIEKHVMLDDRETKYDHFSSITKKQFDELVANVENYTALADKEFINTREIDYLHKSQMKPLTKKLLAAGDLISSSSDLIFRRSGKDGLTFNEVLQLQADKKILSSDIQAGQTINKSDFKEAKIASIIACRLKSSRLKEKALLPIGNLPSVEYCIKSALKFKDVHHTILASSTNSQDDELKNHTYHPDVLFFQGDPEDVIARYLKICDEMDIDVIVRITADMPYVDPETCRILLASHFEKGADYTTGKSAAIGCNLEIINVSALRKIKAYFTSADYSEYMTWYFQNNPEFFNLNTVELPAHLVRDYRLTLDYEEDLILFNKIHDHFIANDKKDYELSDILTFLDANPAIAAINKDCQLKYKTDQALIQLLNEKTKMK